MTAVTLDTIRPAAFEDKENFPHFFNVRHPECFACNSELMLMRPRHVTHDFVLSPAIKLLGRLPFVIQGCWVVFPRTHATTLEELPDDWTRSIKQACRVLRLEQPFCTSENWGAEAGQTQQHAHTWIIKRGHEGNLLSAKKGLATILLDINRLGIWG